MILHVRDMAKRGAAGVKHLQTDQIGVVKFVIRQVRQHGARCEQACAAQGLGLFF